MAKPRFIVKPTQDVEEVIEAERAELARLYPDDSEAFANDTRVMAFMALNDSIESELAYWPKSFFKDAKNQDRTLRYSDIYWWRLIVRYPDKGNIIQVLYLARLKEPKPSVADTIKEMNSKRPPAERP